MDAVSNGTFYNPHEVLGGHLGSGKHADVVHDPSLASVGKIRDDYH